MTSSAAPARVGFVGLGNMGAGMALCLRRAGHEVTVHDVRRASADAHLAAGCTWADSPRAVGAASDVVFTSLPGPTEMRAVGLGADGLIEGLRPGGVWFDLSTNSPSVVREVHGRFAERGVAVLDAPVSGGVPGANTGTLALWIGGDPAHYERFRDVVAAIASTVHLVGGIGAGTVAKLVHNALGYVMHLAAAEVFTVGVRAGVAPLDLWSAVRAGAIDRMRVFDGLGNQFLQQRFDSGSFSIALADKDLRLMTDLARELAVPIALADATMRDLDEAVERGWSARDSRVAMMLQVERAGLTGEDVAVAAADIDAVRQGFVP